MSVRFIGPYEKAGPVAVDTNATIIRGHLVQVANGLVTAVEDGDNAGLAVALDSYPDPEYEGEKKHVDLGYVGEYQEIELPIKTAAALTQEMIGGGPYDITANSEVNVDSTTAGVFTPRRFARDTKVGDDAGYLIGVISDSAAFGKG